MMPFGMPAQPSWHLRVPEIRAALTSPASPPFLDRPAIEQLFGLRRRQAIRILTVCGGYQVGKTFLIHREALLSYIEEVAATGAVDRIRQRKLRISAALNEGANQAAAQRTQIRTVPDLLRRLPADLPPAIELVGPGKIQISFHDATDLLVQVAELAAAATNDFPRFRKIFEEQDA
jgi:hypothetical protein